MHLEVLAVIPGSYTGPPSRAYLYYTDEAKSWAPALRAEVVRNVASMGIDERLLEELLAIDRGRFAPTPSEARALAAPGACAIVAKSSSSSCTLIAL